MKRKIIALALIISAIFAFSSCGGESSTGVCFHDWEKRESEETLLSAATCKSGTVYNSVCSKCGKMGSPYAVGELSDHSYAEIVDEELLVSVATCTAAAVYYKSCEHCGKVSEETFSSGKPLSHTYDNIATLEMLLSAATCSSASTYKQSCSVCGTKGPGSFTLGPTMPHTDSEGDFMCDHCNKPLKVFNDVPVDNLAGRHEFGN